VAPQLEDNSLPQSTIEHQLAGLRPQSLFPGALVCQHGAVTTPATIAGNLATDRRGRSAQRSGNRSYRIATRARDISSRSASVKARGDLLRSTGVNPPVERMCLKMLDDGLPKTRPIDFICSPRRHRSHNSCFWAEVNPTRTYFHILRLKYVLRRPVEITGEFKTLNPSLSPAPESAFLLGYIRENFIHMVRHFPNWMLCLLVR